jgi:tetratricopeptide (TPR) repeat protein
MSRIKSRFDIACMVYLLFIIPCLMVSAEQTAQVRSNVDRSALLSQFQQQLFTSLNSKLEEYQKAFDEDYQTEDDVFDAFEIFKKTNPAYEPILQNWIKESPSSFAPYVARAEYSCAYALQARGNKLTIEKDSKEYQEMSRYYSRALLDITAALKINAGLDVCYALKMEVGSGLENEEMITTSLLEASKNHPYAYRIRLKYLETLTPCKGGSYQMMEGFIVSCGNLAMHNPKIKELSAAVPAEKARIFYYLGKYDQAVKMYTEALQYSKYHAYYADRGDAYTRSQDYKRALADYERALELSPNDPEYMRRKSQMRTLQKQFLEIQRMKGQSEDLDPYGDWPPKQSSRREKDEAMMHAQKGSDFMRAGQFEEAITEFSEAIRILPDEYALYHNRAACYLQMKNDDAALPDFLKAVEKNRDDIDASIKITTIYANRGMYDDALNAISNAITAKPDNAEAVYYRAKVYEKKGMNIEALQDARQACAMGYQRACKEYRIGR